MQVMFSHLIKNVEFLCSQKLATIDIQRLYYLVYSLDTFYNRKKLKSNIVEKILKAFLQCHAITPLEKSQTSLNMTIVKDWWDFFVLKRIFYDHTNIFLITAGKKDSVLM